MKINRNLIIGILVLAAIGAAVYFFSAQNNQANQTLYETSPAAKGDLSASVGATGTVRALQSALLNWQTTGTVEKVEVEVGETVRSGQTLARLAMSSVPQNIILAQADLVSAQKNLEQVQKSNTALAQAQQTLAAAKSAAEEAQKDVDSITFPRASDNLVERTKAEIDLAEKDLTLAEDAYKSVKNRPDGDSKKAEALLALTTARQKLTDLNTKYNWYTGKADELDVETYNAALALALAQLEDAEREVERLKNGPTADDLAAAQARVDAALAALNQAVITAPIAGIVTAAEPLPGDQVAPGTPAFRIDDLSHLLIDVQVSEIDINAIEMGQNVSVSFDAILGQTYQGVVTEVGQVGSSVQGAVEFTITVELTAPDELVRPGMTAAVTVMVKELKDVLLVPNRAVRVIDGQRVVYILRPGETEPVMVEIRLGATSDTVSEVVGGDLKEGDQIVLNPPSAAPSGPMGRPGGN